MNIRGKLKEYIEENGVTQKHIANKVGVSRAMLCLYLKNERNLSYANEEKVRNFLTERT